LYFGVIPEYLHPQLFEESNDESEKFKEDEDEVESKIITSKNLQDMSIIKMFDIFIKNRLSVFPNLFIVLKIGFQLFLYQVPLLRDHFQSFK